MLNSKILLRKSFVRIILTLALPKPEAGWSWTNITKEMKDQIVYKTLRKEWKTASGFYKRLEEAKKRAQAKK
jgi:hypothetical protein